MFNYDELNPSTLKIKSKGIHSRISSYQYDIKLLRKTIQGVLLPDQQTLRGDSRHEDKHY